MHSLLRILLLLALVVQPVFWVDAQKKPKKPKGNSKGGRNKHTGKKAEPKDPELAKYAIFEKSAPRPGTTTAVDTRLPLKLSKGTRIAFIGNTRRWTPRLPTWARTRI